MKKILIDIMKSFGDENTIFCSEADFQFCLAWKIKEKLGNRAEVILEYPQPTEKKINYIDLCVIYDGKKHFIELKYKTKKKEVYCHGVKLELKTHAAQDNGRYDFCADIQRLEKYTEKGSSSYAILLTNDNSYWNKHLPREQSLGYAFSINEEKEALHGKLEWKKGKILNDKSRKDKLELRGTYNCKNCWTDYNPGSEPMFKYLMFEILPNK